MRKKEITIYGTGVWGNRIYENLKTLGVEISCFLKTSPKNKEMLHGIPVQKPETLLANNRESVVILAVKDKHAVKEISDNLLSLGFKKGQIINLNTTIYDYLQNNICDMMKYKGGGESHFCLCCNSRIEEFTPYGIRSELFDHYKVIGGGYREHAICPVCGAIDRNRWQTYVLTNYTNILENKCNVLHIAPETAIRALITGNADCDYYAGDIVQGKTDHKVDLTDMQFKDKFFDFIVANHVLEHIPDIDTAFAEIRRVLKDTGRLLISFPICMEIKTKENKAIVTPEERLKEFGQKDHVRLFGYDYREYIEKYGFEVEIKSPEECLSADEIKKYGLISNDVMLICQKISV